MSNIKRIDVGNRLAGEKSQKPDEFITQSQPVAKEGIDINQQANFDLWFSSTLGRCARYSQDGSTYHPPISAGSHDRLFFPDEDINSGGIISPYDTDAFKTSVNGIYYVSASWLITFPDGSTYQQETLRLELYKNGNLYSELDFKPLLVMISGSENFWFQTMRLGDGDQIELTTSDYYSIRLQWTGTGASPLAVDVNHGGRMNVALLRET